MTIRKNLRPSERIAVSTRNSMYNNQQIYLLLSDETVVNPFPWKGWILISIGAPIGIFFLATLITKAYFQAIEPDFKEDEDNANQWIGALNRLSKINVIWFMLLLVCALVFSVVYSGSCQICGKYHHRVAGQILVDSHPAVRHRFFDRHLVDLSAIQA